MGFWNTIGEAAATYNGDEAGAARFHEARNAGKPDPHVEMQAKTDQILGDVKAIQGKITALGPKPDPAKLAEYNGQLAKAQQAFTDLYHPTKNPGAMQHLGRFLQKHVLKKEPAPLPKSNAVTPGRMTELGGYAAGAPSAPPPAPDPNLTPDELKKKARIAAGIEPRAGVTKPAPAAAAPGTAPAPDKPIHQTADERTRADFAEWKKDHPEYKKTFEDWRYERSHPAKPAKPVGPVHLTPAQNSAQKDYLAADKLSRTADMVAQHPDDAVNQKRLAVALERISAGRFTTQALDYIIKAGWGNTLQQWANNPSTGALPPDIMRQLVDGAHENLEAAQSELDEADQLAPKPPATPREAKDRMKPQAAKPSGKAVSLAEAKKLPAMKGKTDAEITAAIKAAGHEVKP